MSNYSFPIFKHLDRPRRFAGGTMYEIIPASIILLVGFATDYMLYGLIISLMTFKGIRIITLSSRFNLWQRWLHFHWQDIKGGKNNRFFL